MWLYLLPWFLYKGGWHHSHLVITPVCCLLIVCILIWVSVSFLGAVWAKGIVSLQEPSLIQHHDRLQRSPLLVTRLLTASPWSLLSSYWSKNYFKLLRPDLSFIFPSRCLISLFLVQIFELSLRMWLSVCVFERCNKLYKVLVFLFFFFLHMGSWFPDQRLIPRPMQEKLRVLTLYQPGKFQHWYFLNNQKFIF